MRRKALSRVRIGIRLGAAIAALSIIVAACTVEAPDIELVGEGGGGAPALTGGAQAQGQAQAPTTGGGGPQVVGGGSVGGGSVGGGAAATSADSCAGKATDVGVQPTTIKLGSNFAASGPVSNISGPILKGVQAYFNEINATGGVNGRKIIFKWYDDGWDAQKGKALIKKLVEQDKVFVISTIPSSNGLDAGRTYLESKRVPVFGTSGLIESQFRSPMQWPIGTGSKSAGRIGMVYAKERKAQSIAVIWLDLLAGREVMDAIHNAIKPIFGKEPKDVLVDPNAQGYRVSISEPDFGPVWARIQSDTRNWQRAHGQAEDGRPDVVFFAIDPTNAIKALQAAKERNFRPKIFWGGGAPLFLDLVWQSTDYAAKTGLLAGTSFFPPIDAYSANKDVQAYIKTVRKYYGRSVDLNNPYLEGGFAGAALTVEILKRAGSCLTRAKAIQAADGLTNFSAAGLTRPLTYRAGNHYGNIHGLTVKVNPSNKWIVERDWLTDPTPGAK